MEHGQDTSASVRIVIGIWYASLMNVHLNKRITAPENRGCSLFPELCFLAAKEAWRCFAGAPTIAIIVVGTAEQSRRRGPYLASMGITVGRAPQETRRTGSYLSAVGIIVIDCSEQARAALSNLATFAVVVVGATKQAGAASILFLRHIAILL